MLDAGGVNFSAASLGGVMLAWIGGAMGVGHLLLQADPNLDGLTSDQKTQIAMEALKQGFFRPTGGTAISEWLVPIAFLAMVTLVAWLVLRNKQERLKAQNELNKQLLDKFSSGREFGEFLGSQEGQQFLAGLRSQRREPREKILRGVRTGIILSTLGLGMLGLTIARHSFIVPGVMTLAIGVGFLLSAAASSRISRRWEENEKSQGAGPLAV
jgi:hypothetical protein